MRWFASYWVTVVICFAVAGVYWLSGQEVGPLDDRLARLTPDAPPWWMIPALVTGCYAVMRAVLHRVLAYTESAIDASPRDEGGRGRRWAALGSAAYTAFGNPTGWWLAPFATALGLATGFAGVVRWGVNALGGSTPGSRDLIVNLLLMLAILYAVTVTSAMLFPDRPQPLRIAPDPAVDPVLAVPDPAVAGHRPQRRLFGRTKAKKSR